MTDYIRKRSEAAILQAEKDRMVQNEPRKAQMRLEREERRTQNVEASSISGSRLRMGRGS